MDYSDIEIVMPRKTKTKPVGDLSIGTYIRLTPHSKWTYEVASHPVPCKRTGKLLVQLEKLETGFVKWIPPEQRVYLAEEFN
jgi:hypothetical protein